MALLLRSGQEWNANKMVRADMRYDDDVRSLVDKTVARFGRLDVAVNLVERGRGVGSPGLQKADHSVAFVAH
jgi:NAD(P)-dependent dehydrogenase (short-subunit alcohol dehydrogenase family)